MKTYVLKRLLLMIPTLFGVSLVVWAVTAAAPEPPIQARMPSAEGAQKTGESATMTQAVKAYRAQYGLDRPAILNWYFGLSADEIEEALQDASAPAGEDEGAIRRKLRGEERLARWGYYAVPGLVEIVESRDGALRDFALSWLLNNAKRVTRFDPNAKLDAEAAAENVLITTENKILEDYGWKPSDPAAAKQGGLACIRLWYRGAEETYPAGASVEEVRDALDARDEGRFRDWGHGAVAALVRLIREDPERRDAAVQRLVQQARLPLPENGTARDEARRRNTALDRLAWRGNVSAARRDAGVQLVRDWWRGTAGRWDYTSLARKARVLLLETQFARYWGNLLRFDLGYSSVHKERVSTLILSRLKYSLTLSVSSMLLAFLISVPLGLVSARLHGTIREKAMSIFVFVLYSLPSFFVATILLRYLAEGQKDSLGWIPTGQFEAPDAWALPTLERLKDILWHVAAPIFCLTYASLAMLSRYAKVGLLNVIRSDYVRTARAKGLPDWIVTYKHAARNGIIPVVTLLGGTLPVIVSGSFIIEWIFQIPGFGLLMVQSVKSNDFNVIVGNTLITAVLVMLGILLSDLLYAIVDPRISFS